jgi:hypothetical protein
MIEFSFFFLFSLNKVGKEFQIKTNKFPLKIHEIFIFLSVIAYFEIRSIIILLCWSFLCLKFEQEMALLICGEWTGANR